MKRMCPWMAALVMASALTGFGAVETVGGVAYEYTVVEDEVAITGVVVGGVSEVVVPSALGGRPVTLIGDSAFDTCENDTESMISVVIPEGVKTIGAYAFYRCEALTSVTIPSSVAMIGEEAFAGCSALASVMIPSGVEVIGDHAFWSCESLASVTISAGVKTIGSWSFCTCRSLTSVAIPEGVAEIGEGAFQDCESLASVTISGSVKTIGSWAFEGCDSLASLVIPAGVTGVGEGSFNGCSVLTLTVDSANARYCMVNGLFCDKLASKVVSCPGNPTEVKIPDGVATIGDCAFEYCNALMSVTIPVGVTTIGEYAFYKCHALESVSIPESVKTIGDCAFYECDALASVTIPGGVTTIGAYAFEDCESFTSVYFDGDAPTCGIFAFHGVAHDCVAYVNTGAVGFGVVGSTWNGLSVVYRDPVVLTGKYIKLTLSDLGIEPPAAGTVYSVKAYGLPSGLKLKCNAAKKDKKGKVTTKAKTSWWIEGVPTAALEMPHENPVYLAVTVGKTTTWHPVALLVKSQTEIDLGTFTVGTAHNQTGWLPGLAGGGWSVSELPKGLKYTAKTMYKDPKKKSKGVKYAADTTYGKFSSAGLFTVTAKKKKGSFYETLKFKVLVNPAGEFATRNFTAYTAFAPLKDTSWKKVCGLPTGLKFSAKKYTISGKITKAGTFAVTFTDKKGKKKTEMWIVAANPAGPALGFNTSGETTMSVLQGQKGAENQLGFPADGTVSVSGLPKGMKLVKKADGTYALGGVPSATGTFFVTVKATKNGRTVTQRVAVTVEANPVKGTYYGYSQDKNLRYRTASLTIAASGKATLKYTEGSKAYTLTTTAGEFDLGGGSLYTFVQKANTKKKIPARTVRIKINFDDTGATVGGDWNAYAGTEILSSAELCEGVIWRVPSVSVVNALRTDPLTGFASKSTYVLTGKADPAEVIYATSSYSSKTGKFTVKGKLPRGRAFSATVPATRSGLADLTLAPISAVEADGTRYLLRLVPGGAGQVFVDGLTPDESKVDLQRYDFGTGYTALPTTFAAAIYNWNFDYMPVRVVYSAGGVEEFRIRASGTKYFQVSFDGGATWTKKADAKYDKARGIAALSFTKGKTKYAVDLLYVEPERLEGQMKRQSNPVYNKKTKKTTYTTDYGRVVAWPES